MPNAQPNTPAEWYDDKDIADDDRLFRIVKTVSQITKGPGGYIFSDQLWTSQGGGCSVELASLCADKGTSIQDRIGSHGGIGAVDVGVGATRETMNRVDPTTKQEFEPLGVAYTPILPDEPFGPNEYHCDIHPALGNPGRKKLKSKCRTISLDQNMAHKIYKERHGD